MRNQNCIIMIGTGLLVLAIALPGAARAAEATAATPAKPAAQAEEELDEVLVNGVRIKATRDPQKIVNWLKLLVGQFRYEGYVQPRREGGIGTLLRVQGSADCTAFGRAPGVQCELHVTWPEQKGADGAEIPGGIPTLSPAIVQYGLDPDHLGIRYLQVDSKGLANYGQGYLVGDTLTTTTPCVDLPGDCQRISKISARIDGRTIEMQTDIEQDSERLVRFKFLLNRVGATPEGAISGGKP